MPDLFPDFVNIISKLSEAEMAEPHLINKLLLHDDPSNSRHNIRMVYAPFDHVNPRARIVIVGITPGKQQATNSLRAAKRAVLAGASLNEAAAVAKVFASFSGPMRVNLVKLMDSVGLAKAIGIQTTASLWAADASLVHFTSALRYPVFKDEMNWSGSSPNALSSPVMREWLERYTGQELGTLPNAVFVPLGPSVSHMLDHLATIGLINSRQILAGLPHPAGSNMERIKYFLGEKPAHLLSSKTKAVVLDTAREFIMDRVRAIS